MPKVRVLLVDDHVVVRRGMRTLLEVDPDLEVVGEAGEGRTALQLAREHRPHVVLLDLGLPGLNGTETARRLARLRPAPKVIVLSIHADAAAVRECVRAGVRGFLVKDEVDLDLARAVRTVVRGGTAFGPGVSARLLESWHEGSADPGAAALERLTSRQREVLQLVAEGRTSRDIAALLGLSRNTVEFHRKQVLARLGLGSTAALVRFAIAQGIVRDPTLPARDSA
jgi:DNA-binding NarL/FixJ family response regulator